MMPATLRKPTAEEALLFACARQNFPSDQAPLEQEIQKRTIRWDLVYATAVSHGVVPLVWTNLQKCPKLLAGCPAPIAHQFALCTQSNILLKAMFVERTCAVLQFFARHSIPVMLVKGAALDLTVYRQPWYTVSGDIDVVVRCRPADFPQADRRAVVELIEGSAPLKRCLKVEFDWFCHHDVSMNGLLPVDFEEIWNDARPITLQGQQAWTMSPEHMLLAACIGSCRKRFYRLKGLCDLNEIVQGLSIDWVKFIATARQWRCENIAYTALLIVVMTLGTPVPQGALDALGIAPGRARIIQYLSRKMSFSSLPFLHAGLSLKGRRLGASLLLPWAVYSGDQFLANIKIAWRDRRLPWKGR
jgi:Uncharacterised nucleotidyltransferase